MYMCKKQNMHMCKKKLETRGTNRGGTYDIYMYICVKKIRTCEKI